MPQASQGHRVSQAPVDRGAQLEQLDSLDQLEIKAHRDFWEIPDLQVQLDQLEHQVFLVQLVLPVRRDMWDQSDLKGPLDLVDFKATLDQRVLLVCQVTRASREVLARRDHLVLLVRRGRQVLQVSRVCKARQVRQAHLALSVLLANLDFQVTLDHRDPSAIVDSQGSLELPVTRDCLAIKDSWVRRASRVKPVCREPPGHLVTRASLETLGILELQEVLGPQVAQV